MSTPVVSAATIVPVLASSASSVDDKRAVPTLVRFAQGPGTESLDEAIAHMRRRLFRTLDQPQRSLIAIDCGSVKAERIRKTADVFMNDPSSRDSHNLVLAIPANDAFADTPAFDVVQSIKQTVFDEGLDGKVSWLLIHEPDTELSALASLVAEQGGQWHAADDQ